MLVGFVYAFESFASVESHATSVCEVFALFGGFDCIFLKEFINTYFGKYIQLQDPTTSDFQSVPHELVIVRPRTEQQPQSTLSM